LAEKYGVSSYPTIKFFKPGNIANPDPYEGARTAEGIAQFINA